MRPWMPNYRAIDPVGEYHDMIKMNHQILKLYGLEMVSWYGMRHIHERTMTQLEADDLGGRSCMIANNMIRKMMEVNSE